MIFTAQHPDPAVHLDKLQPAESTVKLALGNLEFRLHTGDPAALASHTWVFLAHADSKIPAFHLLAVTGAHKHVISSRDFVHCIKHKIPESDHELLVSHIPIVP